MSAKDIRNIVLLGHGGSGKTTLAESMLFMTGGTDRFGKVTDGNTTCDYDAEEIKRNISISLAVAPVKYKNVKINVLDTPGNFDFAGEVLSGIRAAECAVLVCGAKDGLSVGAERAWKMLGNKPRMIFINRTDEENSDYNACFDALKGKFGTAVAPIVAPIIDGSKKVTGIVDLLHNKAYEVKGGKAAECAIPADIADEVEALRAELMEAAAGADEELMEKFFETMELSAEEIAKGLKLGVRDGSVAPVLCGSAISGLGVDMLISPDTHANHLSLELESGGILRAIRAHPILEPKRVTGFNRPGEALGVVRLFYAVTRIHLILKLLPQEPRIDVGTGCRGSGVHVGRVETGGVTGHLSFRRLSDIG